MLSTQSSDCASETAPGEGAEALEGAWCLGEPPGVFKCTGTHGSLVEKETGTCTDGHCFVSLQGTRAVPRSGQGENGIEAVYTSIFGKTLASEHVDGCAANAHVRHLASRA